MAKRISKEFEKIMNEKKKEFIKCDVKLSDLEATKLLAKEFNEFAEKGSAYP